MTDGFTTMSGGMHGGLDPSLLKPAQFSKGVNVAIRGGLVHTRPAFVPVTTLIQGNKFQGARRWLTPDGDRIVAVYSGVAYLFNPDTAGIVSLGPVTGVDKQAYLCPADRFMIIQDGTQIAILEYDASLHSALIKGTSQIPASLNEGTPYSFCEAGSGSRIIVGTVAHFCHGRIHLVPTYVPGTNDDGRQYFISSDILLPNEPTEVLKWTENTYLNEGGAFGLPDELGHIRAMGSQRNAATGNGVGALIVFARNGVAAFNVALPRQGIFELDESGAPTTTMVSPGWKDQSIAQVLFYGAGTDSPWSVVCVNNDLAYRGLDGIRFIQYSGTRARSGSAQNALSNLPMSSEVDPYLALDGAQLTRVSGEFGLNRLLMTSVPSGDDRTFKGIISMDTAVASGIGTLLSPAYDGIWTGLKFAGVVSAFRLGRPTIFCFSEGPSAIHRLDDTVKRDGVAKDIESKIETKAMFTAAPFTSKELKSVDLWVSGMTHDVDVEVYYRPDNYPLWTRMGSRALRVGTGSLPQERRRIQFQASGAGGDRLGGSLRVGNTFQFLIVWRGWAQIDRMLAEATEKAESPADCRDETIGTVIAASATHVASNDFSYTIGAE
jgi:hypothetical protein